MKRDLICLEDFSNQEIRNLIDFSLKLKKKKGKRLDDLKGKSIGLIFQKPSNRTRVSFEVGIWQLGGNCIYLGPHEIDLGKRESASDVAQTLSRYLDGIVARTFLHSDIVDLGKFASVPIINGLSDLYHPCQAMADIMTVYEYSGCFEGLPLAYVGDGNNVCHSLLLACAKAGIKMTAATPKNYEPNKDIVSTAQKIAEQSDAEIKVTNSPQEAVEGAYYVYADVWTSMGQEEEKKERLKAFENFQVNKNLMSLAHKDCYFMHCLPAHRGEEVTDEVIDGSNSIIFSQAENRMHVQKAILSFLCK